MNKQIIIIPLLLLSCIVWAQQNTERLISMSYNIRLDHAGDAENNWHERKSDMVQYIMQLSPDFLGIQEGMIGQVNYMDQNLRDYEFIGVGRDDGKEAGEFSAVFYDSSKWKLVEYNTFWLSPTPDKPGIGWDAACVRVCTYGIFENFRQDKILVMNTHFDHQGQIARKESMKLINDFILKQDKAIPLILMGDFNFSPSDSLYDELTYVLKDSYENGDHSSPMGTFNGFQQKADPQKRIDYILVNHKFDVLKYIVEHPKTKNDLQLSDHYPVIVELKLN